MPELGRKITCVDCDTKFYDLGKQQVVCPKCGLEPKPEQPSAALKKTSAKRAARPSRAASAAKNRGESVKENDDPKPRKVEATDSEEGP